MSSTDCPDVQQEQPVISLQQPQQSTLQQQTNKPKRSAASTARNDERYARVKMSKAMSFVLRHGLARYKLTPTSDGYIPVDALLSLSQFKKTNMTVADVRAIVAEDSKSRYSLVERELDVVNSVRGNSRGDESGSDGGRVKTLMIRANQGHSQGVGAMIASEQLLEAIVEPLPVCVHGTYTAHLPAIRTEGLKRMSRQHIHLAASLDARSGMRATCDAHIYVDMARAMREGGLKFWRSANGVVLTEGDGDGRIKPEFIERIVVRDKSEGGSSASGSASGSASVHIVTSKPA